MLFICWRCRSRLTSNCPEKCPSCGATMFTENKDGRFPHTFFILAGGGGGGSTGKETAIGGSGGGILPSDAVAKARELR